MTIKIGINGFGRIGRNVVRAAITDRDDIEFVGINDLTSAENLAYLFKYDSVHRKFNGEVRIEGNNIVINGKHIPVTSERDPAKLPWKSYGADVVYECTGVFTKREGAALHLEAGAKWVIISAPGKGDDYTLVYGVNHTGLDLEKHKIISNASCTTNCLAPMAKTLHDAFGIERGLVTTIHAYTATQALLDAPDRKDPRRGRAAALSIIPTTTGAAKAVGKVLPELDGKLDGMAVRVPTPNVSLTDLSAVLSRDVTIDELRAAFQTAAEGGLKGVLDISAENTVSIDHTTNPFSCTIIDDKLYAMGNLVKVLGWYDNEWGFSSRMNDVAAYIGAQTRG